MMELWMCGCILFGLVSFLLAIAWVRSMWSDREDNQDHFYKLEPSLSSSIDFKKLQVTPAETYRDMGA
ncbi:MAG: hypothetical protein LUC43_04940 [Burkholderiales bacterium]|nr:hypothetical protein [Burkholderiales bacterium]